MTEQEKRRYIIETAIGLQAVDGLHVSDFFLQQSERYISGEITLKELGEIVRKYHENDDKKWMQGRRRVYKHWIFSVYHQFRWWRWAISWSKENYSLIRYWWDWFRYRKEKAIKGISFINIDICLAVFHIY